MYNTQATLSIDNIRALVEEIKENILVTLAYFDMFSYPLTPGEIFLFMQQKFEPQDVDVALKCLVGSYQVFQTGSFYSLKNDPAIITRRIAGNSKAAELIKVAERVGRLLIKFPFVRGIAISGSLSKNFADDKADIDFFIITAPNRLWIARTFMHLFKKLTFLVNRQDHFCMNYYVDESQLLIPEKNIYTAIEVVTLIPLQGDTVMDKFYTINNWTRQYLPNKTLRVSSAMPLKPSLFKILVESFFSGSVGNALDNKLMQITAGRWRKKTEQRKLNARGAVMTMATSKHFAKPDPRNFQTQLLERYSLKVSRILHQLKAS